MLSAFYEKNLPNYKPYTYIIVKYFSNIISLLFYISETGVTDSGAQDLVACLGNLSNLRILDLRLG